jgi:rare lipoprotein A
MPAEIDKSDVQCSVADNLVAKKQHSKANRTSWWRRFGTATLQPPLTPRIGPSGGRTMCSNNLANVRLGRPGAVNVRGMVPLLAAVMLASGVAACGQSSLVTDRTALQGAYRQKPTGVAHLHKYSVPLTRAARRKGASYALASFYGEDTETASGEKFNPNELTAAHPTLPFGTRLRVTNVTNGRSVIVRVNDRGPFVRGRSVDVSTAAADRIGMIDQGVAKVKLDVVH